MPKDNIQRAINKGSGGDAEDYKEMRYEGYGPGGVAVIVEALTDNLNRSASNIRACFSKNGGSLGETGSVSFMFDRVGEIVYKPDAGDADAIMEAAIEAGAEDVETDEDGHTIICAFEDIGAVSKALEESLGEAGIGQRDLEAAEPHADRRGQGGHADEAARRARRRRRRPERLFQRGHRGRRDDETLGVT